MEQERIGNDASSDFNDEVIAPEPVTRISSSTFYYGVGAPRLVIRSDEDAFADRVVLSWSQ